MHGHIYNMRSLRKYVSRVQFSDQSYGYDGLYICEYFAGIRKFTECPLPFLAVIQKGRLRFDMDLDGRFFIYHSLPDTFVLRTRFDLWFDFAIPSVRFDHLDIISEPCLRSLETDTIGDLLAVLIRLCRGF